MNKTCIFKPEMYNELLNGRKVKWVADELGFTQTTISLILSGKRVCRLVVAISIVAILTNTQNVLQDVYKYFDKVNKGER